MRPLPALEVGPSGRPRQVWVCVGCGERIDREEHSELRLMDGYWHRSCWIAEADRRAPVWSELRRRSQDRLAVAELLLRAEDRERSGFDVLGRRGQLGQVGVDKSPLSKLSMARSLVFALAVYSSG